MDMAVLGLLWYLAVLQTTYCTVTNISTPVSNSPGSPTPVPPILSSTGSFQVMPWSGLACKRFYLGGLNPKVIGQVQVAGVYHLLHTAWDDFPVWKLEDEEVYLYRDYATGYLKLGSTIGGGFLGVVAETRDLPGNLALWLQPGPKPFLHIINKWIVYDYIGRGTKLLEDADIQALCADSDEGYLQKCTSGRLWLNTSVTVRAGRRRIQLNDPRYDSFELMPTLNIRPMYRISTSETEMYLFFSDTDNSWMIGPSYHSPTDSVLQVRDSALLAEYITGVWQKKEGRLWMDIPNAAIKCKGVQLNQTCDHGILCQNNGRCYDNKLGEMVCRCPKGYRGFLCTETSVACKQPIIDHDHIFNDHITTVFCDMNTDLPPPFWFAVCHQASHDPDSAQWISLGMCRKRPTTTTSTTPSTTTTTTQAAYTPVTYWLPPAIETEESMDKVKLLEWLGDNGGLVTSLTVSISLLVQILCPVLIWLCCLAKHCHTEKKILNMESESGQHENLESIQNRFDSFQSTHPELPENYSREVKSNQEQLIMQMKFVQDRINTLRTESVSFCRIMSLYFYLSLWMWVSFVVVCEVLGLPSDSQVIQTFMVVAHLVIVGLHVGVLVEAFRCRERRRLVKLAKSASLDHKLETLRQLQPDFLMSAECWHLETRKHKRGQSENKGKSHDHRKVKGWVKTAHVVEPVVFEQWLDTSNIEIPNTRGNGILQVHVYTIVVPGDAKTQQYIQRKYQQFCLVHANRDKTVMTNLERGVDRVPNCFLAMGDPTLKSWWMSEAAFWIFSIFGFTWPYRWYLSHAIQHVDYILYKRVYAMAPEMSQVRNSTSKYQTVRLVSQEPTSPIGDGDDQVLVEVDSTQFLHTSDLDTDSDCSDYKEDAV